MNNTATVCEGLNQLASASVVDDVEASEQILQALSSSDPFPINLAWIVPLLSYKHISSLTTHLKRHFEQDQHFQKCSLGGARTHTYKVSVFCFREICQYARHSERRARAQYWIKVIDDATGGDLQEPNKHKPNKKAKAGNGAGKKRQASAANHSKQSVEYNSGDSDNADSNDYDSDYGDNSLSNSSSYSESDYNDIESKSSSLLTSLAHSLSDQDLEPESTSALPSALYNYNHISATTPPKPRVRKDFASVSILNRKRKAFEDPAWVKSEPMPIVDDASSAARPNLRLLSELALGLR